ncbi:MAG: amidohydrolase [Bacteroidales bacterium]|nr:amidohydrolase [Bacteroidales bacterium]
MNNNIQKINNLTKEFYPQAIKIRRHLHQYPELSGHEQQTAQYISEQLALMGIKSNKMLDNTAVVAEINGTKGISESTIVLRADMDALPIEEENTFDFISKNNGVMHACGHDMHMTNILTAAYVLWHLKHTFSGRILLVFQPSEEMFPGGALQLIQSGLFDTYQIKAILGCHVSPEIPTGQIGLKCGNYMASTDELHITIKGKGGHAALPATFINPLTMAAEILLTLEHFCDDFAPKDIPSVLTFGRIVGNGQTNIVPESVKIEGTLRTFDEQWRNAAHEKITEICTNIAHKRKGCADVFINKGYPVLTNDENLTRQCASWAKQFIGDENVLSLDYRMTAEDFAHYSHHYPAVFFRLGTQIEGLQTNLHAANFNANEEALKTGAALMAFFAINLLAEK